MLKISSLTGCKVFVPKKPKTAKDGIVTERTSKLGRAHLAVFSPDGSRFVGLMVKRPDVAGVVKRDDAFVAWDSFTIQGKELLVNDVQTGLDEGARRRLKLDWDSCIMWTGMDAKTKDGKSLGYISDAEFDEKTGRVTRFFTAEGDVSRALIGSFEITPDMVCGYHNGYMIVDTHGKTLEADGGLAAAAGEGYARAKAGASKAGKKAGAVAEKAVDKGSFELGKMIGKAKRAISEATAEDEDTSAPAEKDQLQPPAIEAADVRVEKPTEGLPERAAEPVAPEERPAPKTYAPVTEGAPGAAGSSASAAAKKPAARQAKPAPTDAEKAKAQAKAKASAAGAKAARAAGRQLGAMGKMFGAFKEEFDKASK